MDNLHAIDDQRSARAKEAERVEEADFAWLMSGKRGRRIVWRQLERAGVFRQAFSTDPLAMAFAEGCRNEGLRLLAAVHALPDYALMVAENAPAAAKPPTDTEEAA